MRTCLKCELSRRVLARMRAEEETEMLTIGGQPVTIRSSEDVPRGELWFNPYSVCAPDGSLSYHVEAKIVGLGDGR